MGQRKGQCDTPGRSPASDSPSHRQHIRGLHLPARADPSTHPARPSSCTGCGGEPLTTNTPRLRTRRGIHGRRASGLSMGGDREGARRVAVHPDEGDATWKVARSLRRSRRLPAHRDASRHRRARGRGDEMDLGAPKGPPCPIAGGSARLVLVLKREERRASRIARADYRISSGRGVFGPGDQRVRVHSRPAMVERRGARAAGAGSRGPGRADTHV
jgi:hypothetical protein